MPYVYIAVIEVDWEKLPRQLQQYFTFTKRGLPAHVTLARFARESREEVVIDAGVYQHFFGNGVFDVRVESVREPHRNGNSPDFAVTLLLAESDKLNGLRKCIYEYFGCVEGEYRLHLSVGTDLSAESAEKLFRNISAAFECFELPVSGVTVYHKDADDWLWTLVARIPLANRR
jgi:hypothetical protein